jgi:hypothetical protein
MCPQCTLQRTHLPCESHSARRRWDDGVPVQVSVSAVPFVEKPGEHVHVVAVAPLVLPAGHAEQDDAPAALKVLAVQANQPRPQ